MQLLSTTKKAINLLYIYDTETACTFKHLLINIINYAFSVGLKFGYASAHCKLRPNRLHIFFLDNSILGRVGIVVLL